MDASGVASFEGRLIDDEAGAGISLHARAADLVVVGQAEPGHATAPLMADFPAYVVIHSGRPVLLLPFGMAGLRPGPPRPGVVGRQPRGGARAAAGAAAAEAGRFGHRSPCSTRAAATRTVADAHAADPVPFLAAPRHTRRLAIVPVEQKRGTAATKWAKRC